MSSTLTKEESEMNPVVGSVKEEDVLDKLREFEQKEDAIWSGIGDEFFAQPDLSETWDDKLFTEC